MARACLILVDLKRRGVIHHFAEGDDPQQELEQTYQTIKDDWPDHIPSYVMDDEAIEAMTKRKLAQIFSPETAERVMAQ